MRKWVPRSIAITALALGSIVACALPSRQTTCDGGGLAELFGRLECDLCASRSFCAEAQACAEEPACAELMECLRGCAPNGDAECFAACHEATSVTQRAEALIDCVGAACETEACSLPERRATCDAAPVVTDVFGKASCDLCIRRLVCEEASACADRAACKARMECMAGCVGDDLTPACFDRCRDDGERATGDAEYFGEVGKSCREACDFGTSLDCVGRYSWPLPQAMRVDVQHRAVTHGGGTAFGGLEVTACAPQPEAAPCEEVGQPPQATTDDEGLVTVNVPTSLGFEEKIGFTGYLRWEDPNDVTENGWLDTILVHTRPEYRDRTADERAPFANEGLLVPIFESIAEAGGVALDTERGYLAGGIVDCHGSVEFFAPGVRVEIPGADAQTQVVYIDSDGALLAFEATMTTVSGQFVAINVPPGLRTLRMRHVETGRVVAEASVLFEADVLTVLAAWPETQR